MADASTRSEDTYWRPGRGGEGDGDAILSVREELARRQGWLAVTIDRIGSLLAHPLFFAFMAVTHGGWLLLNLELTADLLGYAPWDPYPFTFLATVTSAEAPFIALLILMRQQRDARIGELRDEVNLQVDLQAEREVTRLLSMVTEMHRHLGLEVDEDDAEYAEMMKPIDPQVLLREMAERLDRVQPPPPGSANGD